MRGKWIREPRGAGVVVFIHGVASNCVDCFTHSNGNFWPKMLANEVELGNVGVYTFDYYSPKGPSDFSLLDIESNLRLFLDDDGVLRNPWIVFVAHSMGGILARHYVVSNADRLRRNGIRVGFFLLSSPSFGSRYANYVTSFTKDLSSPQRDALCTLTNGSWLDDLNRKFRDLLTKEEKLDIRGREVVETQAIKFLGISLPSKIVEANDAAVYFEERLAVANADHFGVAKPSGPDEVQHRALRLFVTKNYLAVDKKKSR